MHRMISFHQSMALYYIILKVSAGKAYVFIVDVKETPGLVVRSDLSKDQAIWSAIIDCNKAKAAKTMM